MFYSGNKNHIICTRNMLGQIQCWSLEKEIQTTNSSDSTTLFTQPANKTKPNIISVVVVRALLCPTSKLMILSVIKLNSETFNCFVTGWCSAALKLRLGSCLWHTGHVLEPGVTFKNVQSLRTKPEMFLQIPELINQQSILYILLCFNPMKDYRMLYSYQLTW